MHFTKTILRVCVALQVVFQGASGAILRGRTSGAESAQLSASDLDTLSLAAEDLDNQVDSFLRNWGGGHRKPDIVEIANLAKRQASSIQISPEDLQNLLKLIQSIERQLAAIIASGGSSASGTALPPPSGTVSNPDPTSSSPVQSDVQPTATGNDPAGSGTTVTQTFTEYVYEDGSSAVPRVVRSAVEVDEDETEDSDPGTSQDLEQDDDWEPWVEFDGTTVEEDGSDVGFTTRNTWASLGVTRRDPGGVPANAESLFVRDEENL
ncbi:uncharacterized protein ColSpa_10485 [Colletotrichum spaethianum]|uniref:Uncharacterized protein n=1 Tax=Colletotrichum spaethianum TaxID=700344 RepID=A0AA37PDQ0_9PEZI|nr:uncharacterized protein ColSpa_10485 [Colletotrichum spaethianum]GKT50304.1 hypothetical protein ColSpa_10485 [Colletotrichum spaethianum]